MPLKHSCLLATLVPLFFLLFLLPVGARSSSVPQYSLVVYGVERQRQEDPVYDHQWMDDLTTKGFDPVVYSSKAEMVEKVLARLGPVNCIRELNLYGHGSPGLFTLGKGENPDNWWSSSYIYASKANEIINDWRTPMTPLKGRFCKDATITLTGCNTGAGPEGATTLFELAKFFGVTVQAPVELVYGGTVYNGRWQKATPQMTQPPVPMQ